MGVLGGADGDATIDMVTGGCCWAVCCGEMAGWCGLPWLGPLIQCSLLGQCAPLPGGTAPAGGAEERVALGRPRGHCRGTRGGAGTMTLGTHDAGD